MKRYGFNETGEKVVVADLCPKCEANPRGRGGKDSYCRECQNEYWRERRAKTKARRRKLGKAAILGTRMRLCQGCGKRRKAYRLTADQVWCQRCWREQERPKQERQAWAERRKWMLAKGCDPDKVCTHCHRLLGCERFSYAKVRPPKYSKPLDIFRKRRDASINVHRVYKQPSNLSGACLDCQRDRRFQGATSHARRAEWAANSLHYCPEPGSNDPHQDPEDALVEMWMRDEGITIPEEWDHFDNSEARRQAEKVKQVRGQLGFRRA